jgi:hypothetical protein
MYLLATSFQNEKYHLVDNIWNADEFYNNEHVTRMIKHSMRLDVIDMVEKEEYDICIFKTFWISIFQRKVKKLLHKR